MPSREKHTSSEISSSTTDDTSLVGFGAAGQPIGLFVTAVATSQIAFLEFMSQCTLAWINASTGHQAVARSSNNDNEQRTASARTNSTGHNRAVVVSGEDWLAVPIITGIEETLNDQFIKPRPVGAEEGDVLALWERSNEFEATPLATSTHMSDNHHDIA